MYCKIDVSVQREQSAVQIQNMFVQMYMVMEICAQNIDRIPNMHLVKYVN
jgi:hypothetical protein